MKSIILYLLALLIGGAICFFVMRGCKTENGTNVISDSLKIEVYKNDSIKKAFATLSSEHELIMWNYSVDTLVYKRKIDSQARVIAILQGRFRVAKDSIGVLYGNLKTFYLNHDTIALADTYQRLSQQLTSANNLLFQVQISRDSTEFAMKQEISYSHDIIDSLHSQIASLTALLNSCTANNSALANVTTKAIRKAKTAAILSKVEFGLAAILASILFLHK